MRVELAELHAGQAELQALKAQLAKEQEAHGRDGELQREQMMEAARKQARAVQEARLEADQVLAR